MSSSPDSLDLPKPERPDAPAPLEAGAERTIGVGTHQRRVIQVPDAG